ncbi:MAG TPA: SusC/RagA family TonB-linked outer membrane protein [Chitinophagaceae bacterium]|nr:SusC/RagA family TonB-linked outer membrane protein [Chitinophagaceae bacterium]
MRKLLLLLIGVVCIAATAMAQRIVTGKVVDEKGNPVANASVLVKGTTTGTVTKIDGTFSFTVPANARSLIISAVDMAAVEAAIGGDNHVEVTLRPEDKTMAEVVVTGYGTQRRREVTGNIASVRGNLVANKPVQSFEQALAGRATGVQITVPHGLLNTPPVFRIRGTNSISLSSYPLIVVDGVPTPTGDFSSTASAGNALASINPADIESIDIAKDAAATAIYGSRAANGVVFITTKKGRAGKPRVSYNGSVGWSKVTRLPEILNAQQYTDFKNKAAANNANVNTTNPSGSGYTRFATATDASGKLIDTYWPDQVYRQGFSHDHNLNISGGNDNTTYYFSVGYTDQEGIVKKNDFIRRNILLNLDSRVNEFLTIGGKISYSNERNLAANTSGSLPGEAFNTGGFGRIVLVNAPSIAPFRNDGSYNIENPAANSVGRMNNTVTVGFYNPTLILDLNRQYSESNHSQGNIYAQIKPVKWLAIKSLYGIDYLFVDNETFLTPIHGDGFTPNGSASSSLGKFKRWTWVNTAQFDYTFRTNHTVSALAGTEQDRRTSIGFGVNRQTLSDPAFNVIQAGWVTPNVAGMAYGENYLLSTFGRINYDFKKKYFLAGNIRKDEYSAFAEKASTFWGASAGWEVSKEAFWEKSSISNWVNNFRLRGSYGKVGNTAGIGDYVIYSTYGSGLYGGLPTLIFNFAGNPNLQWETSTKIDVGTTIGLFRERLQIELARYYNDIKDLILNVPQAPSTGVPNSIPTNVGTMYNKGWELSITGLPFRRRDFTWTASLNITTNKNEVTSLAPGLTEVLTSTSGLETVHRTAVGHSVGTLWLVRNGGVDPATGRRILLNKAGNPVLYAPPGSGAAFTWSNPDGTQYSEPGQPVGVGVTQAKDGVMYGNTIPKVYGGLDNTLRYKDFELSVLLTYQFGFYVYYGTNAGLHDMRFWNNHVDVLKAWSKPGDIATIPKPVYLDNVSNGSALPMSFNAFKGDFVKVKNVSLGYNLPAKVVNKAKLASARIYVGGQNLAIFTDYPGPDPEVSSNGNSNTAQGTDRNTIANGRSFTIGINVSFL